jgi:hypothetical protein
LLRIAAIRAASSSVSLPAAAMVARIVCRRAWISVRYSARSRMFCSATSSRLPVCSLR